MDQMNPNKRTSIVSFNIKGFDSQKIVDKLEKQKYYFSYTRNKGKKDNSCIPPFF